MMSRMFFCSAHDVSDRSKKNMTNANCGFISYYPSSLLLPHVTTHLMLGWRRDVRKLLHTVHPSVFSEMLPALLYPPPSTAARLLDAWRDSDQACGFARPCCCSVRPPPPELRNAHRACTARSVPHCEGTAWQICHGLRRGE